MTRAEAERLALIKYPRYDWPKVNPATGEPDCNLDRLAKNGARSSYIIKLMKEEDVRS